MSPATQKIFHGLRLLSPCGGGAYGEVWYCEDLSGRRMAVKIVSKTRLGDAWKRELLGVINYRRITENSPYLLRIFHVAEDEDCFYYTMEAADSVGDNEYVPDTLAHRLISGALPPEQLFPVLAGVFNGLAAIHQAGFAHRDIKPDNIIFVGGVPKLSDIGLVSSLSNSLTRLAGTLDFLPPEERGGDTGSTDRASRQRNDLYAFGKVVYCAATGMEPGQYPSIPTRAELSPEFKFFIQLSFRLCAGRQGLRIASIDALAKDLARIERELKCGGKQPPLRWRMRHFADRLSEWTRRHMLFSLLLITILAAAAAALPHLIREYRMKKTGSVNTSTSSETPGRPPTTKPTRTETRTRKQTPPPVKPPPPKPTTTKKSTAETETKEYVVAALYLKMRIPNHWQAMSDDHIRALVDEMTKELNETTKDENAKKMLRNAIAKAKTWQGMIRCDLYDVIELSRITLPSTADELWTMPEEKIRREIMAQLGAFGTDGAKIYEIKRIMLADRRCIVMEFAMDRQDRVRQYLFLEPPRHAVVVALTGDAATFERRAREFDAVMKTLEFTAPPPKYETPEPTDNPDTREYVNDRLGFSMRVPLHWELLTPKYIEDLIRDQQALLKRGGGKAAMAKAKLDLFRDILHNGGAAFHCNFGGDYNDCVGIVSQGVVKAELWNLSDEELRGAFQLEAKQRSLPVAIYSISRTKISGRDALIVESSGDIGGVRTLNCLVFVSDSRMIHFAVSARYATFAKRKQEFDAAMKTLKFEK